MSTGDRPADPAAEGAVRPDFQLLFESLPGLYLALLPDQPRFTIVAASDAYLAATMTSRAIVGRGLFEVFPDNPDDPAASGTANLRASLERVVATCAPDAMAVQKYDIRRPDSEGGGFEERHWSPVNSPVLSGDGRIAYLIHRVEDVTEFVRLKQQGTEQTRVTQELRERGERMEAEVYRRAQQLQESNRQLRAANDRLADLDRAKTVFFGNIGHEFRTPLTLIISPVEDALAKPEAALDPGTLAAVHRNALRLLRLVNSLLDFSRLEAGRLQLAFEPLDLAALTTGLVGSFQSLIEGAGLTLHVECPALPEAVYVDRSHWEKIVLNLLSNAYKFTLAGSIAVEQRWRGDRIELEVRDSGTGIPEHELPRIFERFHRVDGAAGRSFEGTGIGLSLVDELVKLHGGSVRVESVLGRGSSFVVTIPTGCAHLPPERLVGVRAAQPSGLTARSYVLEATEWSGGSVADSVLQDELAATPAAGAGPSGGRILVVDDNADMRTYLERLLRPRFEVETSGDGAAALAAARARRPDLVLSDVMMPNLDGFGLLRALRADPQLEAVPVVLLSARAGEEAVVEGIETGADDYLVKPFSARELLSRVNTHLAMARTRRLAAETARELAETRAALVADVERKNQELEAFSYSVSHDLRAPLRAIDGFSRILIEDHSGGLAPAGQALLERVCDSTRRMSALIDDLLRLSRIERADMRRDPVDLTALARDVGETLRAADPRRPLVFEVEPGLVAHGDRRLLRIVLENLLGNAWKFTARAALARIEVRAFVRDGKRGWYVRDNGAGFDPQHADRLFAPFQRLHAEAEFHGTGIGLATVQRIVARHGGTVWAEGQPDAGATFYWTLSETHT